jgi:hypothetical protein
MPSLHDRFGEIDIYLLTNFFVGALHPARGYLMQGADSDGTSSVSSKKDMKSSVQTQIGRPLIAFAASSSLLHIHFPRTIFVWNL